MKALLYIFGDLVMFVVAIIALLLVVRDRGCGSAKFGSVTHGLRISERVVPYSAVPIGFALGDLPAWCNRSFDDLDLKSLRRRHDPCTRATSFLTRGDPQDALEFQLQEQTVVLGWDFYLPVILFVVPGGLCRAGMGRDWHSSAILMLLMSGALPLSLVGESLFHGHRRTLP